MSCYLSGHTITIQHSVALVSRSGFTPAAKASTAFRRVPPPRALTHEVADRIAGDIAKGKLRPGTRLPTEQEMMAALGVSRTVVREAVAALRAEGLVMTRQGVGAFVAEDALRRPFRIESDGLPSITEVLNVMELRTGVEMEAAGLAAERARPSDIDAIAAALEAIDRSIDRGELAIEEDFAFHRGIAAATGNPQFPRFLEFLGRIIIPRQSVRVATPNPRAYLETIQKEHRDIFKAIRARDVTGAQDAMRRHLLHGRERYRKLAMSESQKR
jgi:GntR family transcriptional regulator, transcriptional repressor for pyruvate dehydrogenase complex